MTALPVPLTPADCNLRGMPFMPLMVTQVLQSSTYGLSSGDEFKAAFTLWCASWLEVPAGSLPNDDRMLDFLSRAKSWKKVKTVAMRGWILCADNRFYHPIIAQQAIEAWDKRVEYRDVENNKMSRQQRWRERCKQIANDLRSLGVTPPRGASLEALEALLMSARDDGHVDTAVDAVDAGETSTVDVVEIGKTGTETVKGQRQGQVNHPLPPPPQDQAPEKRALEPEVMPSPAAMLSAAMIRNGVQAQGSDPRIIALAERGVTPQSVQAACVEAKTAKPGERIAPGYVIAILERWTAEAAKLQSGANTTRPAQGNDKREKSRRLADRIQGNRNDGPDLIDVN